MTRKEDSSENKGPLRDNQESALNNAYIRLLYESIVTMSNSSILEILTIFDKFIDMIGNSDISKCITIETAGKAFDCSHFVECTIREARDRKIESTFVKHLHNYLYRKKKLTSFAFSDFETACDIFLGMCLKSTVIKNEVVDEILQMYIKKCGKDRLNSFLDRTITASMCTNTILESLEDIGIDFSNMEDEILITSWESKIQTSSTTEMSDEINKMIDDGYASKLIKFCIKNLDPESKVKELIAQILSDRVNQNDEIVCLSFIDVDRKLFLKYLESNDNFYIDFVDAVFYFGRNMKKIENEWKSNSKFQYEHLIESMKLLLSGSSELRQTISTRLNIAKTQSDSALWEQVLQDINIH